MKNIEIEFIDETKKIIKAKIIEISDKDKFIFKLDEINKFGYPSLNVETVSKFASSFRDGLENDIRVFVIPNGISVQIIRTV